MTHTETECDYCGENTSGTLPLYGEYPCKSCVEKHYHVVDGFLIKKKYKTVKEQFEQVRIGSYGL